MTDAFVKRCRVENIETSGNATAPPLYIRNTASDRCCIILTGHVKIIAGEEGFESECGAWTTLGLSVLTHSVYMPDFTAKVKGPDVARIMYITGTEFRNFIQGKRVPRRSFDQSFGADGGSGPLGVKQSRRQRRRAAKTSGTSSPASHSEEDEEDEEDLGVGDGRGLHQPSVMRLETVEASPRITPSRAPSDARQQQQLQQLQQPADAARVDDSGSPLSPGRSPPMMSLPSPRPAEPAIFRLHSVEKDPYRDNALERGGEPQLAPSLEQERAVDDDDDDGEEAKGDDSSSRNAPGPGDRADS